MNKNMKPLFLIVILSVVFLNIGKGQTNTFPTTGNVGIGTTTPESIFMLKTLMGMLRL